MADLDGRPTFLRTHDIGRLVEMALIQLAAEHAPWAKRRRCEVHQTPEDIETVGAAVERELGLVVLDLGGDLMLKNIRGDIGGIAHQNGERAHERGITKSDRVLRDIDLLKAINDKTKCVVQMTLTTYDEALCRKLEANVCTTKARAAALKKLHEAGIPTVVWLSPILPFINDTEENIRGILDCCIDAGVYGVICFGMGLTLREGNREYFYRCLDREFPHMKEKYIRTYGMSYQIESPRSGALMKLFHETCEASGIVHDNQKIFEYLNTFEEKNAPVQMNLFD